MSKRIIICCDGTWDGSKTFGDRRTATTNVEKLLRALRPRDPDRGTEQVVFYDQGGRPGGIDRFVGGALGRGMLRSLRACYDFLVLNYLEGDELFCFGFSRGACTVRLLSGLLQASGLLEKGDREFFPEAYAYYRTPPEKRPKSRYAPLIRSMVRITPKIKFLGVWDTVGGDGVPRPLFKALSRQWIGFHDQTPGKIVEHAFQALAIDERRRYFAPSIWTGSPGQRQVQQVWFAGVHGNIGGGYPDSGLSDISFEWMAQRAMECGLVLNHQFLSNKRKVDPRKEGKREDSFSRGYRILKAFGVPPLERAIGLADHSGEMIHESVVEMLLDPAMAYRPANLIAPGDTPSRLIASVNGHQTVNVAGKPVPVFKNRRNLRLPLQGISGTLRLEGHPPLPCTLLDISTSGGAKLQLPESPPPGTRCILESSSTGPKEVAILWRRDNTVGVRFAA